MHRCEAAAFLNHKGGVGKTTSVANIGAGLTILGKNILLVDLDPQGHLTRFLGIEPGDVGATVDDVLRGDVSARDAIITRELRARINVDGRASQLSVSLVPGSVALADTEYLLARGPHRESTLKNALADVCDEYDYALFDCSPSLGIVTTNALVAAHKVFIPVQTEYLALESIDALLRNIEQTTTRLALGLEIGGLVATRFDGRKVLSRAVVQSLRERYGALLLDTVIRENIALAESPRFGKDIFSYRPRSFGAADYLNLSLEIMGRIAAAESVFSVERGVITTGATGGAMWS